MVVVSALTGGFGNQLFQYAVGYATARRSSMTFKLDLRHYDVVDPSVPPRPYNLSRLSVSAKPMSALDRLSIRQAEWNNRHPRVADDVLRRLPVVGWQRLTDHAAGDDPRLRKLDRSTYLVGCWQSGRFFDDCRPQLLDEFRFKSEPDAANQAVLDRIKAGPSVSVHVRRTDYLWASTLTKPCPPEYYRAAVDRMATDVPGARFFVFADDPRWARENLPVPSDATFFTHNNGVADTEDLRLMSACDHFVIANSTFSWWGAWLGRNSTKKVFAPVRWFPGDHPADKDIIPAEWTRM